jgi:hypothetical protein
VAVVARDVRASGAIPPRALLAFEESAWSGEAHELEDRTFIKGRPHIRWAAARRRWIKAHMRSRMQFDRFFADDVVWPDGFDVRSDYDITAVMTGHPSWRSDYQWAKQGA